MTFDFRGRFGTSLRIGVVFSLAALPVQQQVKASPDARENVPGTPQAALEFCAQLPPSALKAPGIQKKCPVHGSSSGVVRGDFNGDGIADLAIGEPGATINSQAGAGDVVVLLGSSDGLTTSGKELWFEGRIPGTTAEEGDGFGSALASGDFNGDGVSDLAIGVPNKAVTTVGLFGITTTHKEAGEIIVLYGVKGSGLTTDGKLAPPPKAFSLTTASSPAAPGVSINLDGAHLGSSLTWGDFNHDGAGDLVAGAPDLAVTACEFVVVCATSNSAGGIWELLGKKGSAGTSAGGLNSPGNHIWLEPDASAYAFGLDTSRYFQLNPDRFGASLAAGNFDGTDAFDDLAIGAPNNNSWCDLFVSGTCREVDNIGEVLFILGSAGGLNPVISDGGAVFSASPITGLLFGWSLAAGDFNGDGVTDVAVGVPNQPVNGISGAGAVDVFFGPVTSLAIFSHAQHWDEKVIFGSAEVDSTTSLDASFGWALTTGDFNGDGRADLAIGVPFKSPHLLQGASFTQAGQVDVIYGSDLGLSLAHAPQKWNEPTFHPNQATYQFDKFGFSLSSWNFGRNEFLPGCKILCIPLQSADLAIGIPFELNDGGGGAITVGYGSVISNGLTAASPQYFDENTIGFREQAGAHFGQALY